MDIAKTQSCIDFAQKLTTHKSIKWIDATRYGNNTSQYPSIFKAQIGLCKITIMNGNEYFPNSWLMSCEKLNLLNVKQNCIEAEDAAKMAVNYCKKIIKRLYTSFYIAN